MAVRYYGLTDGLVQVGRGTKAVGAAAGGTLTGGQVVQIVFDDTVFDATYEGKQRLTAALEILEDNIQAAKTWPIDSTS